ncbi:nuclear transport factor 2 family protein [Rugamonas apoptosis]|uniref:Nuclear transport factor 2 family protein n=1 Tax=Rugamonas apoptosis TaxID=2758570 RepID=A0A7W2FBD5_9BURK|nr:nuclear transport factor 2 family protein [Rugamonas apoptosis]MBA5688596.1 nuclear transport factor 2 family protein [Rugamonas apoptosis]
MTEQLASLHPSVAASLASWHDMLRRRDLAPLPSIVHRDAVFRSPLAFTPYQSAQAVVLVLGTVINVFEDFVYHRQFATGDGLSVVLEFSARVGDKQLKGADFIRFDEDGKIVEFEVMVRPLSGLQALGAEMGKRIGHLIPAFKG